MKGVLLLVVLVGCASYSYQAKMQPGNGGATLSPGQHDITLTVDNMDAQTPTQLNFMTFGPEDSVFSFSNLNNGTMRLERLGKTLFETNVKLDESSSAVLLEQSEHQSPQRFHNLLQRVHEARSMLRHRRLGRHLLQDDEEPATIPPEPIPQVPAKALADSIRTLGEFRVTGALASTASGNVLAHKTRQWKMLTHEDFHKGTVEGWKNSGDQKPLPEDNGVSACTYHPHAYSDYYLGFYGNMVASKTFLLPAHTHIRIRARFHFFDKWEGESGFLKVDGQTVWTQSHKWCEELLETMCRPRDNDDPDDTALAINVCGHKEFPDSLSNLIDVSLPHTDDVVKLSFGSNIESKEGSWGVDDVMIYVM